MDRYEWRKSWSIRLENVFSQPGMVILTFSISIQEAEASLVYKSEFLESQGSTEKRWLKVGVGVFLVLLKSK